MSTATRSAPPTASESVHISTRVRRSRLTGSGRRTARTTSAADRGERRSGRCRSGRCRASASHRRATPVWPVADPGALAVVVGRGPHAPAPTRSRPGRRPGPAATSSWSAAHARAPGRRAPRGPRGPRPGPGPSAAGRRRARRSPGRGARRNPSERLRAGPARCPPSRRHQRQPAVVAQRRRRSSSRASGRGRAASTARRRTAMVQPVVRARRAKSRTVTTELGAQRPGADAAAWPTAAGPRRRPSSAMRSASENTMVTVGSAANSSTTQASLSGYQTSSWSARATTSPRARARADPKLRVLPRPARVAARRRTGNGGAPAKPRPAPTWRRRSGRPGPPARRGRCSWVARDGQQVRQPPRAVPRAQHDRDRDPGRGGGGGGRR